MNKLNFSLFLFLITFFHLRLADAQEIERQLLFWENRTINIGTILEENGVVEVEFFGLNQTDSVIFIRDIVTDCGCTTADYSQDTIYQSKIGSVKVNFDPDHRGGAFTKMIIVRTNQDIYGDTLYLQGFNIPFPDDLGNAYPHRIQDVGFRLSAVNMGNVYTNEPKSKFIEIFNFSYEKLMLPDSINNHPEFLNVSLIPQTVEPNQRGLIELKYDGHHRNDFGYVEDVLMLNFESKPEPVALRLMANIFEHFEPVPKSLEKVVPRLGINDVEIDLKDINANNVVNRKIKLSNQGQEELIIRKMISNCECMKVVADKAVLQSGESTDLEITFDPKGRRGIDHKHINIFSNDPVNPIRTIVIRSMIK
ncbi:DUF1573 domain-containing protein [Belliella sp. R4-6]|uniref:DUF1573 domain-containing protein n=1 Tax=Belliella alkalica TaxID=1730871 RepID=A0ABS9VGI6_9BACT|nr:DUF1573 domain-containing protein [Belliella alkalica]MCH7415563.1 DUF1573 domain-containing protein [Belliella alkalica]